MAFTERSMDSIKGKNTLKREPVNELHITVFENPIKSLIQHCERSELRLLKFIKNAKNGQFLRVFEKLKLAVKQYYQTGQF